MQVGVRRTLAAGKGSGVRHLLNITAEGSKPVADPEDDKLWLSLESKHSLLEFDFARTWQQVWGRCAANSTETMLPGWQSPVHACAELLVCWACTRNKTAYALLCLALSCCAVLCRSCMSWRMQ
jgi:hypothetical protein